VPTEIFFIQYQDVSGSGTFEYSVEMLDNINHFLQNIVGDDDDLNIIH